MRGRGVLFALSPLDAECIRHCPDGAALARYVVELAETLPSGHHAELDGAWLPIHFSLAADPRHDLAAGALLGGEPIPPGPETSAVLQPADRVPAIAEALAAVDERAFRAGFAATARDVDGEFFERDLAVVWGWFQRLRALYRRAARDGRAVLLALDRPLPRAADGSRPAA
jgi:hypothetical protein